MLTYSDLLPDREPTKKETDKWDEEVRRIREAWEEGRDRHARRTPASHRHVHRVFDKGFYF